MRELTRLHEARESPWWVEAIAEPVRTDPAAGGFESVDVILRTASTAMALQCLRTHPRPTYRFDRRTTGRSPAGNLFTTACEVLHTARGDSYTRDCPALIDAACRALRGAAGLAGLAPGRATTPPQQPPATVIPTVLTMAHLTVEAPLREPHDRQEAGDMARERFWVWLLTEARPAASPQRNRHPVAVVTWTGLRHFLAVADPALRSSPSLHRTTASSAWSLAPSTR